MLFLYIKFFQIYNIRPQIILNYRRKSIEGLSQDFVLLNIIGFLLYTIYNYMFYFDKQLQIDANIDIQLSDILFSTHATIITGTLQVTHYFLLFLKLLKLSNLIELLTYPIPSQRR